MSIYMLFLGTVIHLYIFIEVGASSVPINLFSNQDKTFTYGGNSFSFLSTLIPVNSINYIDAGSSLNVADGSILGGNNIIDDLLNKNQEQFNLTENKKVLKLDNETNRDDNSIIIDYGAYSSSNPKQTSSTVNNNDNLKLKVENLGPLGEVAEMHTNNHILSNVNNQFGHNSRHYNNYQIGPNANAIPSQVGHHKSKYQHLSSSSNPYANTLNLNYIHSLLTKPPNSNSLSSLIQSATSSASAASSSSLSASSYGFTLQNNLVNNIGNSVGGNGYMAHPYSSSPSSLTPINGIHQTPQQKQQNQFALQEQFYNSPINISSNSIEDSSNSNNNNRMCGKQQIGAREPRIVGGNNTYEGEFPWAVSIQRHGNHHCGGVIVGRRWILTAAHCVRNQLVGNLVVRTGGHTLTRSSNHINSHLERDYLVDQIIMHGDFSRYDNLTASQMKSSANTNNADIALLRLKYDVHWNEFAWPVCFPNKDAGNFSGHDAVVIGWGKLNEKSEDFSNELQKVKLTIIDNKVCQNWFRQAGRDMPIDDRIICAGFKSGGKDACHGDSGGPLLSKINGHYVVVGVVSTGIGCARPLLPGLYSRVSSYIGWLESYVD